MSQAANSTKPNPPEWKRLVSLAELEERPARMQRVDGRQIAVFKTPGGIRACDNRCPHEGYPLSEGSLIIL